MALGTKEGCSYVPDGKAKASCDAHDVNYKEIWVMRKQADDDFLIAMLLDDVWKPKAYIYYWGVRILGRLVV